MLLSRLIRQAKIEGVGGKFERIDDANSDEKRKESIEKFRKVTQGICKDFPREELIEVIAIHFHRLSLAGIALEISMGGQFDSEIFSVDAMIQELKEIKNREHLRAKKGGEGKAEKFKALEAETIRLYQAGKWTSAPMAAQEITPKIVALSLDGKGDLFQSTTKPLQWIRAHVKSLKSNPS